MGTPFKMKGSPMQRNFGIGSPLLQQGENKHQSEDILDNDRSEKETREWLKSQKRTPEGKEIVFFREDINIDDIWNRMNDAYLEKGNPNLSGKKRVDYFTKIGNEEVARAEKHNTNYRAYLKSLEGILPTEEQEAKSKGTLRETPKPNNSKIVKLKNKAVRTIKNLFGN